MKEAILRVQDLHVRYHRVNPVVEAVKGVDFSLRRNDALGLIGESGCGKTSIAWALCGLHTEAEVTGCIEFGRTRLDRLTEKGWKAYRSKKIGLVFQNSLEALNPVMTVYDQAVEPLLTFSDLTPTQAGVRVRELLNMVGLEEIWWDAYPHQLSGGMRQRVLVAMALVCKPEILVVDEPTTSLDANSRAGILELLKYLQRRMGFAMLFISHDLASVAEICSRLMVQYQGRVVETGLVRDVLADPRHPYTRGLINASPSLLPYRDLWGIPGTASETCRDGCAFFPRCCQADDACRDSTPELEYVGIERRVACHKGGIVTLLQAAKLTKTFTMPDGSSVEAVQDADIEIRSGEIMALVGVSGSGKSTLAQMLAGVLSPDGGSVFFKGKKMGPFQVGRGFGGVQMVFQDPFSATSPRFTVADCVEEPLRIMGRKADWANIGGNAFEAVREALSMVGLPTDDDFLARRCHSLSGGQRQRAAFARAMVTRPAVVIADETTSMLDPSSRANLLREIKGLQNARGFAMLFVTHDLSLAGKVADRVSVMHQGRIKEAGAAFEVLEWNKDVLSISK